MRPSAAKGLQSRQDRLWQHRVDGALRFLEELKEQPEGIHDGWKAGMARHYRKALELLLSHPPPGHQAAVKAYLTRFKRL